MMKPKGSVFRTENVLWINFRANKKNRLIEPRRGVGIVPWTKSLQLAPALDPLHKRDIDRQF